AAGELLCRSGQEPDWNDTHRDDDETASCSCPTMSNSGTSISRAGGSSNDGDGTASNTGQPVPPIYCRNCGYFVEGSRDSSTSPVVQILSPCRPPADPIDLTRNETLLVDYETVSIETTPARCSIGGHNDVNRNNTIDDSGTADTTTTTTVDIDMLTMQMMVASASSTVSRIISTGLARQLDTMNNNSNGNNTANETKNLRYSIGTVAPDSSTGGSSSPIIGEDDQTWRRTATPSTNVNSENNNIIIDSSTTTTTTISPMDHRETPASAVTGDIIHQCPNTSSNQCCNQPPDIYCAEEPASTGDDHTNGNAGNEATDATTETQPAAAGIRSLLNENGLVRLDMSQIIDNTGLPTYEAALKLESSGYV
uniref:Uncharacterized protein n=1 Tax=Anopheles maculatus TaxID=74869 RepID=A0A182T392_9DIPT